MTIHERTKQLSERVDFVYSLIEHIPENSDDFEVYRIKFKNEKCGELMVRIMNDIQRIGEMLEVKSGWNIKIVHEIMKEEYPFKIQ